MNWTIEARKLVNFINGLDSDFREYLVEEDRHSYCHIGALYTNIFLQAGLNYKNIVQPRVERVLLHYSEAETTSKFQKIIESDGLAKIIQWWDSTKLTRIQNFLNFSEKHGIETCNDLRSFLNNRTNQELVLMQNGVGPKTLDYLMKLLNFDTVAVDRHIVSFVEMADINVKGYQSTKRIVEYAADFMEISRSSMDYSIWRYMSDKQTKSFPNAQLCLPFE